MTKTEIENAIKSAYPLCKNDEGWVNIAEIGVHLRKNGVRYGKLTNLLQDFDHIVEVRIDTNVQPPNVYVKLIV